MRLENPVANKGRPKSRDERMIRGRFPRTQVRLAHLLFRNPYTTTEELSQQLHMSPGAVRVTKLRVGRKVKGSLPAPDRGYGITKLLECCPDCLHPKGLRENAEVCSYCGREHPTPGDARGLVPYGMIAAEHNSTNVYTENPSSEAYGRAPTLELHGDRALGSETDFRELLKRKIIRLAVSRRYAEYRKRSPLKQLEKEALSQLWSLLKGLSFSYRETNDLAKLLKRELRLVKNQLDLGRRSMVPEAILRTLKLAAKDFPRLNEAIYWLQEIHNTDTAIKAESGKP